MPTSGGYVIPADPACYSPRMTRAAALAMRTAGTLRENCVVVITDGPTIGTAGNTSVTEIELNPDSPTEFGLAARVFTTFAVQSSSWAGTYDIDLGVSGSITHLTDNFQNEVVDEDADSPTVHTQMPWHLGDATNFNNNYFEDCTMGATFTPNATQGVFARNWSRNTVFNFTNKVGGTISNSEFRNTQVNVTGGGTLLINRSKFITSNIGATGPCVDITGASNTSLFDCQFFEGFSYQNTGTGAVTLTAVTGEIHGVAITLGDIRLAGAIGLTMQACYIKAFIGASSINLAGAGGSATITGTRMIDTTLTRTASVTSGGTFNIIDSELILCTLATGAAATSPTFSIPRSKLVQVSVTLPAAQRFFVTQSTLFNAGVTFGAGATRGIAFTDCEVHSCGITQNRTGGTNSDTFQDCRVYGLAGITNMITLAGATNPAVDQLIARQSTITDGAVLTITDPSTVGGVPLLDGTEVRGAGTALTLPAGAGRAVNCRFAAGAIVNLGTFVHTNTIVDGLISKTFTAQNNNRLANKGFSDVI